MPDNRYSQPPRKKATLPALSAKELSALLDKLGACPEAKEWAEGKTLRKAWSTCERGDWMLWLAGSKVGKNGWPSRKVVVLAACDCAETTLEHVPAGEDRPRKAIEMARLWAHGKATLEEVRSAAYAARAAENAAHAASYAAHAASYAAARSSSLNLSANTVRKHMEVK